MNRLKTSFKLVMISGILMFSGQAWSWCSCASTYVYSKTLTNQTFKVARNKTPNTTIGGAISVGDGQHANVICGPGQNYTYLKLASIMTTSEYSGIFKTSLGAEGSP